MLARQYRDRLSSIYNYRLRLRAVVVSVVALTFILIAKILYLQVVNADFYKVRAENNRINVLPILPVRGQILDRYGRVLSENQPAYALELKVGADPDSSRVIESLREIVFISDHDQERVETELKQASKFSSLVIKDRLSEDEASLFTSHAYRFPELQLTAQPYRRYPYGLVTSHVIGHLGRVNQRDLLDLEDSGSRSNYVRKDWIGKRGVEQYYEKRLRGGLGYNYVEVNSKGKEIRIVNQRSPLRGENVVLTIDIDLQKVAYESLGDRRGAVVAIDPNNGEILSYVSKPGYDPDLFIGGMNAEQWREIQGSADRPLLDRVTRGLYPPGSTLKPFLGLAALEDKLRTPSWKMSDPGFFSLSGGQYRFRDWKKEGHGQVDLHKAIAQSCDTYFYQLADDMGIDELNQWLLRFGFGKKTGIDLSREYSGIAPSRSWKKKRFGTSWYRGDTISVGIGQGYNLVTPLQLAVATAALANGGTVHQPTLTKRDQLQTETVDGLFNHGYTVRFSDNNRKIVHEALKAVMKPGGTAVQAAQGATYEIAGKTGTAQVFGLDGEEYNEDEIAERLRDHALFIAYAPADKPQLAVAVIVENGGHGGSAAAPVARQLFDQYLLNNPVMTAERFEISR